MARLWSLVVWILARKITKIKEQISSVDTYRNIVEAEENT